MRRSNLFGSRSGRTQRSFLFHSFSVFQILEEQKALSIAAADALSAEDFGTKTLDDVVGELCARFTLVVPEIDGDEISVSQREVDIEVKDFDRIATVKGTAIDVEVPFVGLSKHLETQPSRYDHSPPEATVKRDVIEFTIQGRALDAAAVEEQIDSRVEAIQTYLENLATDFQQYNNSLCSVLTPYVEHRKQKLDSDDDLTSKLKYKKRDRD